MVGILVFSVLSKKSTLKIQLFFGIAPLDWHNTSFLPLDVCFPFSSSTTRGLHLRLCRWVPLSTIAWRFYYFLYPQSFFFSVLLSVILPCSECALWYRSWDWNLVARQKFMIRTLEKKVSDHNFLWQSSMKRILRLHPLLGPFNSRKSR